MFLIIVPDDEIEQKQIKWKVQDESYTIHVPVLKSMELSDLFRLVLMVADKVRTAVSDYAHKGPLLFTLFARVLAPLFVPLGTQ